MTKNELSGILARIDNDLSDLQSAICGFMAEGRELASLLNNKADEILAGIRQQRAEAAELIEDLDKQIAIVQGRLNAQRQKSARELLAGSAGKATQSLEELSGELIRLQSRRDALAGYTVEVDPELVKEGESLENEILIFSEDCNMAFQDTFSQIDEFLNRLTAIQQETGLTGRLSAPQNFLRLAKSWRIAQEYISDPRPIADPQG